MSERAPIEVRTVALSAVDYPARTIDLIAVPWDEWQPVEYQGRIIHEAFQAGAFGAVEKRVGRARFQVNIDHDPDRWVGRVTALHPSDRRGLRADLQIRRTAEGDQVLMDAADGMLAGSVGFGVLPADQRWESRDRRRITKAYLDHIALTPTPAYQGSEVIAVRSVTGSGTPNLDRILAERTARAYRPS
jgi:HK97 family phage prohead protease